LGSAISEFNKAKDDVQRQITQSAEIPPATPHIFEVPTTPPPKTQEEPNPKA